MYLSDKTVEPKNGNETDHSINDTELNEFIAHLPPRYQTVVQCLIIKNLSVRETAQKLNITEANVRKRFERAKKMLKMLMKGSDLYETGS